MHALAVTLLSVPAEEESDAEEETIIVRRARNRKQGYNQFMDFLIFCNGITYFGFY